MSIIAWLVVGILAGWLAERITGRNHGLLTNLIVGIVGAFIGGLWSAAFSVFATWRASTCPPSSWRPLARSFCSRSLAASKAGGPPRARLDLAAGWHPHHLQRSISEVNQNAHRSSDPTQAAPNSRLRG